uniref:Uncharacterized protein n=1 Tax=Anguilla anguilla TaxID=7936 RepID=A0A0E9WCQ6_ANGAN
MRGGNEEALCWRGHLRVMR